MDINEIIKERHAAEVEIASIIRTLEERCGVRFSDADIGVVRRSEYDGLGNEKGYEYIVELKIVL